MKPLLYAGALLMVGASIYGFADYKKTSRDKRFKTLYHETKVEEAPISIAEKKETPEIANSKEDKPLLKTENVANVKKTNKKPKKINAKLYSRAALETYEPVQIEEEPSAKEVKLEN